MCYDLYQKENIVGYKNRKGQNMQMNDRLNGFMWGVASGGIAAIIIGLSMGWVVSSSKANVMANKRAQAALITAMTPVCVDKFQRADGYANKLAALKNISLSWERRDFVAKGSWANVGKETNFEVADACAESLNKL
jgi:hypothetical protein